MNRKPARAGPRIRVTKPSLRYDPSLLIQRTLEKVIDQRQFIYTCQYCRLKFSQNSHYFRHMTSNHQLQQSQALFECNDCQIVFSKKANLDLHCQSHHQARSKSRCESCAITFKSRYCLRRHLKLKQILQENACLKCHKKFMSKEYLIKHIQNKHSHKNVTFECDFCSLKFKAKESLMTHLTRIHKKL